MRLIAIVTALAALVGCGRMNPMNPSYDWDGEDWRSGPDTGGMDTADTGDSLDTADSRR